MPFFLSSKPASPAPRAKRVVPDKTKAAASPPPGKSKGAGLAWIWLLLGLLLCAGLGAGWIYGVRALRTQLAALHPAPTGPKALRMDAFRNAPWVTEKEIADLTQEMGELLTDDPLDGECLQKVANRLRQHLAVKEVLRVYRDDRGFVQVQALLTHPAGWVPNDGKLVAVDAEGRLLSAEGLAPEAVAKIPLPVIEGVKAPAPWGKVVWKDPGLQAALQLVLRLPAKERFDLRRITLGSEPAPGGKTRITLDLRFEPAGLPAFDAFWGLPPGEEKGVDAPADDKLRALRGLYARPDFLAGQPSPRFSIRAGSAKLLGLPVAPPPPAHPAGKPRNP